MTIKLEVEVPEGATKIDIGPVLEPILARLVRLERIAKEYDDTPSDNYAVWKDSSANRRPVTSDNVKHWIAWTGERQDFDRRIADLNYAQIAALMRADGWLPEDPRSYDYGADYYLPPGVDFPGIPRQERWIIEFQERSSGYGGARGPFDRREKVRVPLTHHYPEAERIYLIKQLIGKISKVRCRAIGAASNRVSAADILEDIECALTPLEALAHATGDGYPRPEHRADPSDQAQSHRPEK